MKHFFIVLFTLGLFTAPGLWAHGGGMGSESMMGSSGMLVVADDGSLLLLDMGSDMMDGGMGDGSGSSTSRDLVNISSDGVERWRVTFTDGWPMMPITQGDLVVVSLTSDWMMGGGGMGDGEWSGMRDEEQSGQAIVVGLDLATGTERWRTTLDGDMASMAQFSPDGTRIYLTLMEMGSQSGMGSGSMHQGDASGSGMMMDVTLTALDRNGSVLWTYNASQGSGGMGAMRRQP